MNDLETIQNKIYEIRGQRVMLDHDLAELYGVETKRLNEAVKRNAKRFEGDDFMFQLTKDECLRSQIVTLNDIGNHDDLDVALRLRSQIATSNTKRGGTRYLPYAFTELGVAMLSSVLRSETAKLKNQPRRNVSLLDLFSLKIKDEYNPRRRRGCLFCIKFLITVIQYIYHIDILFVMNLLFRINLKELK